MATTSESERVHELLIGALRQVGRRFAGVTHRWAHPQGVSVPADLPIEFATIEAAIIENLAAPDPAQKPFAIAALRISDDVQQLDLLVAELARRPVPQTGLSGDLLAQLVQLSDLTTAQLDAAISCLAERNANRINRTLLEEVSLDDWYDLLLAEVLDEMSESALDRHTVVPLLAVARVLERISGHVHHITLNTQRLLQALAPP